MPIRVLLVSPDDQERTRLLEALEAAGFAVRTAVDVAGATAGLAEQWPDVAVLDLLPLGAQAMDLLWSMTKAKRPVPIVISRGPRSWEPRLIRWLERGLQRHTPQTRAVIEAVSQAIRGPGPALLPVA